jgi:hypothetical protein
MPTVYIETTIIGYLTARSSNAVIFLARQQLTRQRWNEERGKYELVASQLAVDEAGAGDPTAAQERLVYLSGLPLLDIQHPAVPVLADRLIAEHVLPKGCGRRAARCRFGGVRRRLFVDMELYAHRESGDPTGDLPRAASRWSALGST